MKKSMVAEEQNVYTLARMRSWHLWAICWKMGRKPSILIKIVLLPL